MKHASSKGFTLLEILVVLTIVGVIVSSVSVFITSDSPEQILKKEVGKFLTYADHASESAMIGGETIGLILMPPQWRDDPFNQGWAYRWQKQTNQGWADLPDLQLVDIPKALDLIVMLDGVEWSWEKAPEIRVPIIAFFSSGEVTPFEVEFALTEDDSDPQHILVGEWGNVIWKEREEELEDAESFF